MLYFPRCFVPFLGVKRRYKMLFTRRTSYVRFLKWPLVFDQSTDIYVTQISWQSLLWRRSSRCPSKWRPKNDGRCQFSQWRHWEKDRVIRPKAPEQPFTILSNSSNLIAQMLTVSLVVCVIPPSHWWQHWAHWSGAAPQSGNEEEIQPHVRFYSCSFTRCLIIIVFIW